MSKRSAESDALLDELWTHAVQERLVCRQDWVPGDVLVRDNRSLIATARDSIRRRGG